MKKIILGCLISITLSTQGIASEKKSDDFLDCYENFSAAAEWHEDAAITLSTLGNPVDQANNFDLLGLDDPFFPVPQEQFFQPPQDLADMLENIIDQIDLAKSSDTQTAREYSGYLRGAAEYLNSHEYVKGMSDNKPGNIQEEFFKIKLEGYLRDIKALTMVEKKKRDRKEEVVEAEDNRKKLCDYTGSYEMPQSVQDKIRAVMLKTDRLYADLGREDRNSMEIHSGLALAARDNLNNDPWLDGIWKAEEEISSGVKACLIALDDVIEKVNAKLLM
jgi:hypothetical protein